MSLTKKIVLALIVIAAIRIFILNAAFPLFNNMDEDSHYDLVVRYAQGKIPKKGDIYFCRESTENIMLYRTPEYLIASDRFPDGNVPHPLWKYPIEKRKLMLEEGINALMKDTNHEVFSPPVYYTIAAMWYNAGKLMGIHGGYLLFWLRFLNVPLFVALMYVAHLFTVRLYPSKEYLHISVPLLLAFFPQDVFYSIGNDSFSSLFFIVSLFMVIKLYRGDFKKSAYYALTGLLTASTFLVKYSNVAVVVLFIVILFLRANKARWNADACKEHLKIGAALTCFTVPVMLWFTRNYIVLGDITGDAEKIKMLGWTKKSFFKFWDHPIFTLDGTFYFYSELVKKFWRGEQVWMLKEIASVNCDIFYVLSSTIFIAIAMIVVFFDRNQADRNEKTTNFINLGALLLSVISLLVYSMMYNFGECWYPSQALPFITSGRLIIGAIVPFLVIYLNGFNTIVCRFMKINPIVILSIIVAALTISEIAIPNRVFHSEYNWFHLF